MRQRPRVTDFKSGAKAAGQSLWHGWKDGITGLVTQPRTGYQRHGVLGGAAGALSATVNVGMKPTVGMLSSVTWLSRGTYASMKKAALTFQLDETHSSHMTLGFASSSSSSPTSDYEEQEDESEICETAKIAARVSGFRPKVCQQILEEFDKIQMERKQILSPSSSPRRLCIPQLPFKRNRSRSAFTVKQT